MNIDGNGLTEVGNEAWMNDEGVKPDLSGYRALYWRLLIMPMRPKTVSKGGIIIPVPAQESEATLNYVGQLVAVGSLAWGQPRLSGEKFKPQLGEWVLFGRYSGQRIVYKGVRYLTVNEDELLGVVDDPRDLRIHI